MNLSATERDGDPMGARYILGTDIGGTFTDFLLLDTVSGQLQSAKVPSDPEHPEAAVLAGVRQLEREVQGFLSRTHPVVHGTTLAINVLIERRGPRTALLTTRGFRDVLEMRTGSRGDIWDLSGRLPTPLIPRPLRLEATERVAASGELLTEVDPDELRRLADQLREAGVAAVAISFLHSYSNPANERAAEAAVQEALGDVAVCCSSDVLPTPGEFARTSATAANAYLMPVLSAYLPRLVSGLQELGLGEESVRILASEGSQSAPSVAAKTPVRFVESGPVGGVLAAAWLAGTTGLDPVLALDIGGTTAKTAVVEGGVLPLAEEYEVAREYRFAPGSGLPLNVPSVDVIEIGAGGGSVLSVTELGLLGVGPRSAGSRPGPACYGLGGTDPTLTDADVVLGLIDPGVFTAAGGDELSRAAIEPLAKTLGISVHETALRAREVALAAMATSIQAQLAQSGINPQELTIVAYGGAGPLYAVDLATSIGARGVVVPPAASVFSAFGMVVSNAAYTAIRPLAGEMGETDCAPVLGAFAAAREDALTALRATGAGSGDVEAEFQYAIEARYAGQSRAITVRIGNRPPSGYEELRGAFEAEYAARFGYQHGDQTFELVGVRVTALRRDPRLSGLDLRTSAGDRSAKPPRQRQVFAGTRRAATAEVYRRTALLPDTAVPGPALVDDFGTSVYVPANWRAEPDPAGNLHISRITHAGGSPHRPKRPRRTGQR